MPWRTSNSDDTCAVHHARQDFHGVLHISIFPFGQPERMLACFTRRGTPATTRRCWALLACRALGIVWGVGKGKKKKR